MKKRQLLSKKILRKLGFKESSEKGAVIFRPPAKEICGFELIIEKGKKPMIEFEIPINKSSRRRKSGPAK